MPIADRLVHALAVVTPTTDSTLDEYGQPVAGEPIVELVDGLVQPRKVQEIALAHQAGAEIGDHVIFLPLGDHTSAAFVRFEPDDGVRYDIVGIRRVEFGTASDHLELDCRRITSAALAVEAS